MLLRIKGKMVCVISSCKIRRNTAWNDAFYHAIRHILSREMTQNITQFDVNHDTGGC